VYSLKLCYQFCGSSILSEVFLETATGSGTTSYAIEEKGDLNELLPPETETERQFLIKWVGWSHLHNTWESLETLTEMKAKGLKKLDNFCKVILLHRISFFVNLMSSI